MPSKIRLKLGPVEVEYEGDEKFFKEELPQILGEISRLVKETGIGKSLEDLTKSLSQEQPSSAGTQIDWTVSAIASKLDVKSGPQLIIAAAANLTFVDKADSFTRDQVLNKMKTASAYYKNSYLNNCTKYLNRLVKSQKLIQSSPGKYALSAATKSELDSTLAS